MAKTAGVEAKKTLGVFGVIVLTKGRFCSE
jgi:hypothetical protein